MALCPRLRSSVRRNYGTGVYSWLYRLDGGRVVPTLRAAMAREVLTEEQDIRGDAKQTKRYFISAKTGDVMTVNGWIQILLYMAMIFAITKPLGSYMYRVFEGDRQPLPRLFGAIERLLCKLCGVDPKQQQDWKQYTLAMLVFSAITLLVTYGIERLQHVLPLNPQNFPPVAPDLAFNTAASFTTNTNWQAYSGESTMSYLTQMAGLAWHNFISAAAGIAVAIALARGLTYHLRPGDAKTIGNFWVDLIRCTVYVLLPICIPVALVLVSQGIIQNFSPYVELTTVEGAKQTLALGPVASQEVSFGVANSTLWATVTTDTSCGAVNSMHDSYTPLGGLVPLANIQLSEVVFGGVGSGLYGMLVYVLLAVFIAGLMVGRTPEYLGKKIEAREMKLAMLYVLIFPLIILGFSAWAAVVPSGTSSIANPGPHGLSEILYAFSSGAGNNGSAFAGLNANTRFYNVALGFDMLVGRFLMLVPALGIAGSMVDKKVIPTGPGTFPTTGALFVGLLIAVVVIVGALTFFPALSLGPLVEHFAARAGRLF